MRPCMVIGFGVGLVLTLCGGPLGAAIAAEPAELIVRFEPGATAADRLEARKGARADFERQLPVQGMQLVEVESGQSAAAAERSLESADGVLYAEPNATVSAFLRPNDPYFPQLWAMENTGQSIRGTAGTADADIDATGAWDARVAGGTIVAVIDTGVDATHPDLAPNLLPGHDFVAGDEDPADENGHGTHVAGTIAAERGNGIGVAGVADDAAKILPLRVLDGAGSGRTSDVILAYGQAFQSGAKVVNLSLGSTTSSRAEHDAIAAFPTMLFVAAAGNGGPDGVGDNNDAVATYPCAYLLPNVVCVAASDNRDQLASFSNYGALSVDLAAPGVSIASTWPGGGYSWSSGTSMATPHVAGAAALLWAAAPNAQPTDISSALLAGVDARPAFTGRTVSGGRLNVLRSLQQVADVGVGTPAPVPSPDDDSGSSPSGTPGGSASGPSSGHVGDAVPPRLSLRTGRRLHAQLFRRHRLPVRLTCSEACTVHLVLRFHGRALSGKVTRTLAPDVTRRVALRLNRAGRALLRRRGTRTLTLNASAVDRTGNGRTVKLLLHVSS
jgi:subtilisin family serine protease